MSNLAKLFDIKNKTAIVTGSARGNGKAIALGLAELGANVIGIDILSKELFKLSSLAKKNKLNIKTFVCDLNKSEDIINCLKAITKKNRKIDILINNAGVTYPESFFNYNIKKWEDTYNINLKAPFIISQQIACIMKKNKKGSIINITSLAQKFAFSNNPAYGSFKSALAILSKNMAMDLGKYNIRVNNIVPGYIKTNMTKKSFSNKKLFLERKNRSMLNRWGDSKDLIGAVVYLSTESSSFVTGQDIYIDGGWSNKGI